MSRPPRLDERGSGTALVAVLAVLAVVGAAVFALVGTGTAAVHRARGAADLSALAGAEALQTGTSACADAARVAERNAGRLEECVVAGERVTVVVSVEAGWRVAGLPDRISARAAAEPV